MRRSRDLKSYLKQFLGNVYSNIRSLISMYSLIVSVSVFGLNFVFSQSEHSKSSAELIEENCYRCHGGDWSTEAGVDFSDLSDEISIWENRKIYTRALDMLNRRQMPPPDEPQLSNIERNRLIQWLRYSLNNVDIEKIPKNPSFIPSRRLNRYQYNFSVQDIFCINELPDDMFPSDLTMEDSFDNNVSTLTTEPLWFERSLKASRRIVDLVWSNSAALDQLLFIRPTPPRIKEKALYVLTNETSQTLKTGDGNFTVISSVRRGTGNIFIKSTPLDGFTRGSIQLSFDKGSITYQIGTNRKIVIEGLNLNDSTEVYLIALNVEDHRASLFLDGRLLASVANFTKPDLDANLFKVGKATRYKKNDIIENDKSIEEEEKYILPPIHEFFFYSNALPEEKVLNYTYNPNLVKLPEPDFHWYRGKESYMPTVVSAEEAATKILDQFLQKAFRRPPTEDEKNRYLGLFLRHYRDEESAIAQLKGVMTSNVSFDLAMQVPILAALSSPSFLMQSEEAIIGNEIHPVSSIDMASRLSYFLWSSGPDEELISAGIAGQLLNPEEILRQTDRMLQDDKANRFFERFILQWLRTEGLGDTYIPDQSLFPEINESLMASMKEEGVLVFGNIIRQNNSLLQLLYNKSTYMNYELAEYYGYEHQLIGNDWQEVELSDTRRGGLLTQAAVLTVTSAPSRTSPVFRGKWVLDVLLGEPPPPPPPNVPVLNPEGQTSSNSLRELLASHRNQADCATCHDKIDPYGLALEQYDPVGKLRDKSQNTFTTLWNGKTLDGASELREFLLNEKSNAFIRHLTEKMMSYALSRDLIFSDERSIFNIISKLEQNDFRAKILIHEIVLSEPFRLRKNDDAL